MQGKLHFDVGIVVPLAEELEYVLEVAPLVRTIDVDGAYFYVLDFGSVTAVAHLIGGMGLLAAQHATRNLLDHADVRLLVMLGTAGALDDDLSIGDVAIATEVTEYLANAKAEKAGGGYELRHSGQHWPLDYGMKQILPNFEFAGRSAYQAWQGGASAYYDGLEIPKKHTVCKPPPVLHCGNVASGTVVVASKAFARAVKRVDRKFIAIDMEAAGFAYAASSRIHPVPHLVVRGISDRGDEKKKKLDKSSKNGWRRYCVRNATTLLKALLSWDGFLGVTGLAGRGQDAARDDAVRGLIGALRGCPGGAWAAGIGLGIYTHGPLVKASGNVVPTDVTRLRVDDPRFDTLMLAIEAELKPGFDPKQAGGAITAALVEYRRGISSATAETLIHDFDEVVLQIVFPDSGLASDQGATVLDEAERIYEDQGPQAIADFLKDRIAGSIELRERYIDALAEMQKSAPIFAVVRMTPCANLTRLELEHGMFACARLGETVTFDEIWSRHAAEFDDAPAKLLRQELSRQFPGLRKGEK